MDQIKRNLYELLFSCKGNWRNAIMSPVGRAHIPARLTAPVVSRRSDRMVRRCLSAFVSLKKKPESGSIRENASERSTRTPSHPSFPDT